MKITQLYTISQFIDKIQSRKYQKYLEFHNDFNEFSLTNLGLIYRYNEFLKQPVLKEMFVNDMEHPKNKEFYPSDHKWDCECENCIEGARLRHNEYFKIWDAAQKKVIFEGWNPDKGDSNWISIDGVILIFDDSEEIEIILEGKHRYITTLHDLAEATNGMLQTKNITL